MYTNIKEGLTSIKNSLPNGFHNPKTLYRFKVKQHKIFLFLLLLISTIITNCKNPKDKWVEQNIDFKLYENHIIPNLKYSSDIVLEKKLTREELEDLAYYFYRKKDLGKYKNSFLVYYLPNMKIGNGGWASTHFRPNLELEIYGLSVEDEKHLLENKFQPNPKQQLIGEWIDEWGMFIFSIYKENKQLFGRYHYTDGSNETNTLHTKGTKIFDNKKYTHNEYYLLSKNYELGIYDEKGLIYHLIKTQ